MRWANSDLIAECFAVGLFSVFFDFAREEQEPVTEQSEGNGLSVDGLMFAAMLQRGG